jgi:hypothetical protein
VVLIAVIVVVAILSLAAYRYSDLMTTQYVEAENAVRARQVLAFADSGIQYAAALLGSPDNMTSFLQGNPYDNTAAFQDQIVQPGDQPYLQGRFSVVAPIYDGSVPNASNSFRFGVIDESSKINICTLVKQDPTTAYNVLMMLPNMTPNLADAIVDWIDSNDTPRTNGAENDTYSGTNPAYQAKNGPIDSLEELLLVQGMTPQMLFGTDRNRNGILDPGEDDGTGTLDPGLGSYLTLYTREQNIDSSGNPRIYVNGSGLQNIYNQLSTLVSPEVAAYLVIYRQYGPYGSSGGGGGKSGSGSGGGSGGSGGGQQGSGLAPTSLSSGSGGLSGSGSSSSQTGGAASQGGSMKSGGATSGQGTTGSGAGGASGQGGAGAGGAGSTAAGPPKKGNLSNLTPALLDFNKAGSTNLSTLYDLINTQVLVPGKNPKDPGTIYTSPLNGVANQTAFLPLLLDHATAMKQNVIPGRVNVLTANQTVLTALPGITADNVQTILALRPQPADLAGADPMFQTPAWLLTQAGLTVKQLTTLDPYITTVTQVYRVQVLGYFDQGPTFARVEAVIDTNGGRPRILMRRDISTLGKGFDLSPGQ